MRRFLAWIGNHNSGTGRGKGAPEHSSSGPAASAPGVTVRSLQPLEWFKSALPHAFFASVPATPRSLEPSSHLHVSPVLSLSLPLTMMTSLLVGCAPGLLQSQDPLHPVLEGRSVRRAESQAVPSLVSRWQPGLEGISGTPESWETGQDAARNVGVWGQEDGPDHTYAAPSMASLSRESDDPSLSDEALLRLAAGAELEPEASFASVNASASAPGSLEPDTGHDAGLANGRDAERPSAVKPAASSLLLASAPTSRASNAKTASASSTGASLSSRQDASKLSGNSSGKASPTSNADSVSTQAAPGSSSRRSESAQKSGRAPAQTEVAQAQNQAQILQRQLTPEAHGIVQDAVPHVLLALDSYKTADPLGTFRELETALDILTGGGLPDGEIGLKLLEQNLPSGYQGNNLVEIYRETARSVPGGSAANRLDNTDTSVSGPQGMGSMGAADDTDGPASRRGSVPGMAAIPQLRSATPSSDNGLSNNPDLPHYLSASDRVYVRKKIDEIVAAFGEVEYPHSDTFEQQVEYFIHQYQTELRGFFERSLVRSVKYLPMVEGVLRTKNVPETMAYIAFVESGFRPSAASSVGAVGLWQFMPKTGRAYGLRIDKDIDERLDPIKATVAAREYFLDLVAIFGSHSFLLAIASYNAGEGKVQYCLKQVDDPFTQRTFWDIRGCLRQETREYIPRIIAAAIAAEDPARFGFTDVSEYMDPERYEVANLPFSMPLNVLADMADVSVEGLRAMNGDLTSKDLTTPKGISNYALLVPKGKKEAIDNGIRALLQARVEAEAQAKAEADRRAEQAREEALARAEARQEADRRAVDTRNQEGRSQDGKTLEARLPERKNGDVHAGEFVGPELPGGEPRADDNRGGKRDDNAALGGSVKTRYEVRPGNSIYQIARDFNTTASRLRDWNPFLSERELWNGDVLEIQELPDGFERKSHKVKKGETLGEIADRYGVSLARLASWNGMRPDVQPENGQSLVVYIFPTASANGESTAKETRDSTATASSASSASRADVVSTRDGAGKKSEKSLSTEDADLGGPERMARTEKSTSASTDKTAKTSDKASDKSASKSEKSAAAKTEKPTRSDKDKSRSVIYEVQKGNTLYSIATIFDVTIKDLMTWNALDSASIREGQRLILYPNSKVVTERYTVKKGDTLPQVARRYKLEPEQIRAANGMGQAEELRQGQVLVVYRSAD